MSTYCHARFSRTTRNLDPPSNLPCLVGCSSSRQRIRWRGCTWPSCNRVDFQDGGGAARRAPAARARHSFRRQEWFADERRPQDRCSHSNGCRPSPCPCSEKPRISLEAAVAPRSEEHTSELQSPDHLVCR